MYLYRNISHICIIATCQLKVEGKKEVRRREGWGREGPKRRMKILVKLRPGVVIQLVVCLSKKRGALDFILNNA